MTLTEVSKRLRGRARRSFYKWFEKENLSIDILLEVGKIINHDFVDEIPELKKLVKEHIIPQEENVPSNYVTNLEKCKDELYKYMSKVILLQDEVNELREKLATNK